MRSRRFWLGVGTMCAGLVLGVLGQRGSGQSGELPGLRPPTSSPALDKDPSGPMRPAVPDYKAPPSVGAPAPEIVEPGRFRLPDVGDLPPPRHETAPAISSSAEGSSGTKQEPIVSVEWVGAATAQLNQPLACQILVRNSGPVPVHSVLVRHRLSPGVTCRRIEPPATTERDELVWTVGTLQPGQQRRLELHLVATQRGTLNCQATVSFAASAGQQVQVREPLLLVKMRAPEKAVVGENVNLLFAVANPGDGVAELVRVKALLPDGLDSARGRVVDLDVGNLSPKESRMLQIACVAKTSGIHKSTIVASAEGNLRASDHAVTDILEAKLDLAIQGPKLRYLDRHAVYTLKVANPGAAPSCPACRSPRWRRM